LWLPNSILHLQAAFKVPKRATNALAFGTEWKVWDDTQRLQCLHTASFYGIAICTKTLLPSLMTELGTCSLAEYVEYVFMNFPDQGLNVSEVQRISFELLVGSAELHIAGYAHRDLKPCNAIMVGASNTVKLIDFGSFKCVGDFQTGQPITMLATHDYAAPELLTQQYMMTMRQEYGVKIDSWSWGATVLFMATNMAPWSECSRIAAATGSEKRIEVLEQTVRSKGMRAVLEGYYRPSGDFVGQWLGPEGMDVLVKALEWDLKDRLTAAELLKQPWFEQLRQQLVRQVELLQANSLAGAARLSLDAAPSQLVKSWKEEGLV
jgi:serine/threonine protein kinase